MPRLAIPLSDLKANRSGHVTPHEFTHPVGDNVTALPNGHGVFNRG